MNLASGDDSFPNQVWNVYSLYLTHDSTLQTGGHFSPQKPIQSCPQESFFLQGSSHAGLSQISEHSLEHFWCSQLFVQGSRHGSQIWPHPSLHFPLWEQFCRQGLLQGGQTKLHLPSHSCPQMFTLMHLLLQSPWNMLPKHSPHSFGHLCPHSSTPLHSIEHPFSFTYSSKSISHLIFFTWPHGSSFCTTWLQPVGSVSHLIISVWPHFSFFESIFEHPLCFKCISGGWPQSTYSSWPHGSFFRTLFLQAVMYPFFCSCSGIKLQSTLQSLWQTWPHDKTFSHCCLH